MVLYSYQIGEARDRAHKQYLVVFTPSGVYPFSKNLLVGWAGFQTFDKVELKDGKIVLTGQGWKSTDPQARGSLVVRLAYTLIDEELVAAAVEVQ